MKKWIQDKLYKWLKKTDYHFPLPILETIIHPENLKKFHAQHIIPYYMWNTVDRWVEPDCFVKQFKDKLVDELLKEIQIKVEETPEGICYSCDLLFENI